MVEDAAIFEATRRLCLAARWASLRSRSRILKATLPTWHAVQRHLLEQPGPQATASLRKLAGAPCVTPPHLSSQPERIRHTRMSISQRVDRRQVEHSTSAKETPQ